MGNVLRSLVAFIPSERCQRLLVGDLSEMPLDRTLDLSGLHLRRLPLAACAFGQLVKLYLSNNRLGSLPPELGGLASLQLLALDFNSLEELPVCVCGLPQLNTLYLSNNRLHRLPPELALLTELRTLWLETNCFSDFPPVLCRLPALRTLHAGYNQLRALPPELAGLGELHSLWLAGNQLADFPPVLLEMHQLGVVDVDRNRIRRFPPLTHLRGLRLVVYDHNPCVNAPAVGPGVRRVGRWADCPDEEEEEEDAKVISANGRSSLRTGIPRSHKMSCIFARHQQSNGYDILYGTGRFQQAPPAGLQTILLDPPS
ncbi:leucine-rich repeat-containing protein 10 [Conger conger]|uniref:leucine-rich repeat-containing protein 10 n=1 Tax=Conger conger TaxID=82655 RepID=UPI002A59FCBE|nr:leucine-rich repeat-containing protein 10 [Conger conger]